MNQADLFAPPPESPDIEPKRYRQFVNIKAKYPNTLLVFKVGKECTCYEQDAVDIKPYLDICIDETKDGRLVAVHFDERLFGAIVRKLIKNNLRVALCEPVDESKQVLREGLKVKDGPKDKLPSTRKNRVKK
jgi:DNA mismatch repair ATPase MutS